MSLKRSLIFLLLALVLLWLASTSYRSLRGWTPDPPATLQVSTYTIDADWVIGSEVSLAWREYHPDASGTAVLLLHGNPVAGEALVGLAQAMGTSRHLILPDLPGLGYSARNLVEFSAISQVKILRKLIEDLEVERLHLVAYSQGGPVALEFSQQMPERVASLTLVATVGLQEYELLGDYDFNQPLYRLYEAALWGARWLLPHFGLLDAPAFDTSTARNFAETDLRRNRPILKRFEPPVLILHGPGDRLVPFEAAQAHARLLPQAYFETFGHGHMALFQETKTLAERIESFLNAVEAGRALDRTTARSTGGTDHQPALSVSADSMAKGTLILMVSVLLFFMVYLSEDLTCITAGVLASAGVIPLYIAILVCACGIWVSDFLIFLIGKVVGSPVLKMRLFKRLLPEASVAYLGSAYARNGLAIVVGTRFIPGSRVAAYLVAGTLKLPILRFSAWLAVAVVLWTPVLVTLAYFVGTPILQEWKTHGLTVIPKLGLSLLVMYLLFRLGALLSTEDGRFTFRTWRHRTTRWEYWPSWVIYTPVFLYGLSLAARHRSLTLWALSNPGIEPMGGLVLESKSAILSKLDPGSPHLPKWSVLAEAQSAETRIQAVESFMAEEGLDWPIVIKPDIGQRGEGVAVLRSRAEMTDYLQRNRERCIVQEYLDGEEYGVFFVRPPGINQASIFSITKKVIPSVEGDGKRSLEALIKDEPQLLGMSKHYLKRHATQRGRILAPGERLSLVDLGTHCRGAVFLDGNDLISEPLAAALNELVPTESGICLGRFDLRASGPEALRNGKAFNIIELNGVSSESTDIYDPKHSILDAWRKLCRQWEIAFEIGAAHRAIGHRPPSVREVLRLLQRASQRTHFEYEP